MGPSPLSAVKNGWVDAKYDTKFVFAEVNSMVVFYEKKDGKEYKPVETSSTQVG